MSALARRQVVERMPRGKVTFVAVVSVSLTVGMLLSPIHATPAEVAVDIRVFSADVFTGVLDELVERFEHTTGQQVTIVYGTAGAVRIRVEAGETGDVVVLPRPMLDEAMRQGRVVPGSTVDLARSAVGLAVRRGAPKPDISSVDAFTRSILAAKSVSYPDPRRGGATGILFARVVERLGIAEDIERKTRFPPAGQFAVDVLARGEAEVAIAQPMEILAHPGVELVGLLPPQLQDPPNFVFSASVLTASKEPRAAADLIQFLSAPAAAAVLKARGMNQE